MMGQRKPHVTRAVSLDKYLSSTLNRNKTDLEAMPDFLFTTYGNS
jgi:hypothetical protein